MKQIKNEHKDKYRKFESVKAFERKLLHISLLSRKKLKKKYT